MALGTNEQTSKTINQLPDGLTNVITVPNTPTGGVVNSAIQQDDRSENVQIKSTVGLQTDKTLIGLSKL